MHIHTYAYICIRVCICREIGQISLYKYTKFRRHNGRHSSTWKLSTTKVLRTFYALVFTLNSTILWEHLGVFSYVLIQREEWAPRQLLQNKNIPTPRKSIAYSQALRMNTQNTPKHLEMHLWTIAVNVRKEIEKVVGK